MRPDGRGVTEAPTRQRIPCSIRIFYGGPGHASCSLASNASSAMARQSNARSPGYACLRKMRDWKNQRREKREAKREAAALRN